MIVNLTHIGKITVNTPDGRTPALKFIGQDQRGYRVETYDYPAIGVIEDYLDYRAKNDHQKALAKSAIAELRAFYAC